MINCSSHTSGVPTAPCALCRDAICQRAEGKAYSAMSSRPHSQQANADAVVLIQELLRRDMSLGQIRDFFKLRSNSSAFIRLTKAMQVRCVDSTKVGKFTYYRISEDE